MAYGSLTAATKAFASLPVMVSGDPPSLSYRRAGKKMLRNRHGPYINRFSAFENETEAG